MSKVPNNPYRPATKKVREAVAAGSVDDVCRYLTVRQRRFAEEYCIDYVGKAAVLRAGYQTKHPDKIASSLLKNEGVAFYIDHLTRSKEVKIISVDPDYIIQQVVAIIGKPGAKDSDRLRGLELLARHLGMFVDKTEITGKDGGPLEIHQKKIEEDASNFTNLLRQLQERADRAKESEDRIRLRHDGEGLRSRNSSVDGAVGQELTPDHSDEVPDGN